MIKALTKEEILAADDMTIKSVEVPEWGGTVYIRTMSSEERDRFEADWVNSKGGREIGMANFRARSLVLTICDAEGVRLFDDSDVALLAAKSIQAIEPIFVASQKLNRISDDDIQELAGN